MTNENINGEIIMEKCKPITRIADIEVLVSHSGPYGPDMRRGLEKYIEALREWAKDFEYFVDDLKHQCATDVEIREIEETICSNCDNDWEEGTVMDDDKVEHACCSCCLVRME